MATIDLNRLNDSQHAVATRLDEPLFVAAGAGSGKTFTLTARLVHALSRGSAADGGDLFRQKAENPRCSFILGTDQQRLERRILLHVGSLPSKPVKSANTISWKPGTFKQNYCFRLLFQIGGGKTKPHLV